MAEMTQRLTKEEVYGYGTQKLVDTYELSARFLYKNDAGERQPDHEVRWKNHAALASRVLELVGLGLATEQAAQKH